MDIKMPNILYVNYNLKYLYIILKPYVHQVSGNIYHRYYI